LARNVHDGNDHARRLVDAFERDVDAGAAKCHFEELCRGSSPHAPTYLT